MCNFISVNQTPKGMVWLRSCGRVNDTELCLPGHSSGPSLLDCLPEVGQFHLSSGWLS